MLVNEVLLWLSPREIWCCVPPEDLLYTATLPNKLVTLCAETPDQNITPNT